MSCHLQLSQENLSQLADDRPGSAVNSDSSYYDNDGKLCLIIVVTETETDNMVTQTIHCFGSVELHGFKIKKSMPATGSEIHIQVPLNQLRRSHMMHYHTLK